MKKQPFLLLCLVFISFCLAGCSSKVTNITSVSPRPSSPSLYQASLPLNFAKGQPGALVSVDMQSKVGVLLDEIPDSMREKAAQKYLDESTEFWKKRAENQIRLTYYRLTFRGDFYDESEKKHQLPLPPQSVWNIEFQEKPHREMVDGHDIILVPYSLTSTILTDRDSPGISEPALEQIGGVWEEPFVLPIDPVLLFQRTSFACIDEDQFPPLSVDPEEVTSFYDQECDVEDKLSSNGCHQSVMPKLSCVDTLKAKIGKVETSITFKRISWDDVLADKVRVGDITSTTGADLQVFKKEFHVNRLNYRYIEPDSCALEEKSVGASGWRRLLQFTTSDQNTGATNLNIGAIDYFLKGINSNLSLAGIFEFSACHRHYHFTHYGSFYYGDKATTVKQGFCLQSTQRVSNNELSPTHNPYFACDYQGVASGWADQYKAGLENQWIDVTKIDTKKSPVTEPLVFKSNPDGFLCEGTPTLDEKGALTFEPTAFKTKEGKTVSRPVCNFSNNWDKNNVDSYNVTLPVDGEGAVTSACSNDEAGPLRDCGFQKVLIEDCTPGKTVKLSCTSKENPMAVRICETSKVLGTAIPCSYNGPNNAQSLTNKIVENNTEVSFVCPAKRDSQETGGQYSLYTAPILPGDTGSEIDCKPI